MTEERTAQVISALSKADKTVSDTGQMASDILAGMGMMNSANSITQVCGSVHGATSKGRDYASVLVERDRLIQQLRAFIEVLEEDFAPSLSTAAGVISELEGLDEDNWSGDGAEAYSKYADKQSKAASELSASALQLATLLREDWNNAKAYKSSFDSITIEFALETIASVIGLIPPITAAGVFGLVATVAHFYDKITTANTQYDQQRANSYAELSKLKKVGSSPGASVFVSGKWPDKQLYSGD